MGILSNIAGAFAAPGDTTGQAGASVAAGRALGAFGLPQDLNPYAPPPTARPAVVNATANVAKEDAQPTGGGFVAMLKRYQRVLLIVGGALVLVLVLLKFKRKK